MATTIPVACSFDVNALLALALLAALSACGPSPSDQAPSREPRASVAGPSESPPVLPHSPSPHHDPVTPAASPVPLASNHASPSAAQQDEPAPLPEQLVLPQWIAQALEAPDVRVRLRALDRWAQQGPEASLDPLVVALDDKDDDVRAKAMALIERQWAVAQEAEPKAVP
jgi:HEAT repeat protein